MTDPAGTTVRTVEDGRLLWWREEADEEYWWRHFEPRIGASHEAAAEGRLGELGEILTRHLPREGRILEAGCGTGWLVAGLRRRGFDVEGVEGSPRLAAEIERRYPELPVRLGDVTALDVPDGHYRGYVSIGVIEHAREGCDEYLREACRVVAPGGILCVSVPHFNVLRRSKARLGAFERRAPDLDLPFYQYGFTRRDFARVFAPYELEPLAFAGYGTARCVGEELPRLYGRIQSTPGLWRLPRLFDRLDWTGLATHMILAVLRRRP